MPIPPFAALSAHYCQAYLLGLASDYPAQALSLVPLILGLFLILSPNWQSGREHPFQKRAGLLCLLLVALVWVLAG